MADLETVVYAAGTAVDPSDGSQAACVVASQMVNGTPKTRLVAMLPTLGAARCALAMIHIATDEEFRNERRPFRAATSITANAKPKRRRSPKDPT